MFSQFSEVSDLFFPRTRSFHSTAIKRARRRPQFPSVKAADLGLIDEDAAKKHTNYTKADEEALSKKYNPAQVAAIKAGEESTSPHDLYLQSRPRGDLWRMTYKDDDLSEIDATLDRTPKREIHRDSLKQIRPKSSSEMDLSVAKFLAEVGEKAQNHEANPGEQAKQEEEIERHLAHFVTDSRSLFEAPNEEAYQALDESSHNFMRKPLPKINDPVIKEVADPADSIGPEMRRLQKELGWSISRIKAIETKMLYRSWVVNQTRMGKIQSAFRIVIAGNRNGLLGVGIGKSREAADATMQARISAIRNMKPIKRYEERTIFGEVTGKSGAVRVRLRSMGPGQLRRYVPLQLLTLIFQ